MSMSEQPVRAALALDEPAHRALGVLDALDLRRAARRRQHPGHQRVLVHVEDDELAHHLGRDRANVGHGLVLLRMRLWPKRPSTTTRKLTRDTCERRGPAHLDVHAD